MISFVNAKINLGLRITGKLPNGYHTLETIFIPIGKMNGTPLFPYPFNDILEISPASSDEDALNLFGETIDCPLDKNIVYKALVLFNKEISKIHERKYFKILLDKRIPFGAGLGGGSADAAFTLKMLNSFYDSPFSENKLAEMALSIGADCPFFIYNTPCLATGIGENLEKIDLNLSDCQCLLIKPDINISTKEAYAGVVINNNENQLSLKEIVTKFSIEEWRHHIFNDFEASLFPKYPKLHQIKEELYEAGALYASMSGSGSTIYGLFPKDTDISVIISNFKHKQKHSLSFLPVSL